MFDKSADIYDAIYSFKDYGAAASKLDGLVQQLRPGARSLLDLACGTGRHLEYLKIRYEVEGLDLNADLLDLARARCPGVPLHQGDMTDFALERTFDVITCLFSSIGYVRTTDNLNRTLECITRHLAPGGLVLIEPWFTPEAYWTGTITANHVDQPDRKVAWMYVSERSGQLSVLDIHYMVGTPTGIRQFREVHEIGLFEDGEYQAAFGSAGLKVTHIPDGFFGRGLYIGSKAGETHIHL